MKKGSYFESIGFSDFESRALTVLDSHLMKQDKGPLLTNNEDDLLVADYDAFVEAGSQGWLPRDILDRRLRGEYGQSVVARNLRIGRNMIRKSKSEMYTDRIMTATDALDTCRSVYRAVKGKDFISVVSFEDDSLELAQHRVGDYVDDLLQGGRDSRVLKSAAMQRTTETIREKFDFENNPEASLALTALAGMNSRKKSVVYVNALHAISKGFDRMRKIDKDRLNEYIVARHPEHQRSFDLMKVIQELKRAQ